MSELSFDKPTGKSVNQKVASAKRELIRNIPQLLSAIICIIVVLMTFADFSFKQMFTAGFAANSALFVILSYGIYYAQKTLGKRTGCIDNEYLEYRRIHQKATEEAVESMNDDYTLNDYCAEWSAWEADKARKTILSGTGVTEAEWAKFAPLGKQASKVTSTLKKLKKQLKREKISQEDYDLLCEMKKLPAEKKLAIVRACFITKQKLSPADLVYESANREAREKTPTRMKTAERNQDLFSLVPLTLMMAGMLLIVPEIGNVEFTLKTVLYGLMRLFSLIMTAFRGNMNGETLYTVNAVDNFKIQIEHLKRAIKWRERHERTSDGRDPSVEAD